MRVALGIACFTVSLAMMGKTIQAKRIDFEQGARDDLGRVQIEIKGDYRYISADGMPNHKHGRFPSRRNPNRISPQRHHFRIPLEPKVAETTATLGMHPFGVALNGVPFDPNAAEFWQQRRTSGWQYAAIGGAVDLGLDQSNAHVQPNGAYHYHGIPHGLVTVLKRESETKTLLLVGYAADGFPLYLDLEKNELHRSSYRLKEGVRPEDPGPGGEFDGTFVQDYHYVEGTGGLDACNGRTGNTPEYPEGTYYYVITEAFPYVPRLFRGTVDRSFLRHRPHGHRRH